MEKDINILIADDHYLIAKLLKMMLITSDSRYKVSIARHSSEVFDILNSLQINLLLLDIDMPEIDGLKILKTLRAEKRELIIMMISNHTEPWIIKRAMNLGANGYLCKYADSEEVVNGIKAVLNGEIFMCKGSLKSIYSVSQVNTQSQDSIRVRNSLGHLSKRELEVLKFVLEEYSSKEISELLFISTRTVETHRKNILNKLGVNNSLSLIKLFVESNILESLNQHQL